MTLLTALEVAGNYPDNILITHAQHNTKYSGHCYLLRDGDIHKEMLSTTPVFSSSEEAESKMHEIAKICVDYVSQQRVKETSNE